MITDRIKPLNAYFDKVTILGDLKNEIHIDHFSDLLEELGFKKADYRSRNYGYKEIYKHPTKGYIEFAEVLDRKETDHNRLNRNLYRIKREREHIKQYGKSEHMPTEEELNSAFEETLELLKQCDERGFLKRMKDIRFEFNPKYATFGEGSEDTAYIQELVIGSLKNKHCTQVHIAFDYPQAIQKLMLIDKVARTECIFRDSNKKNQTVYLGDRSSREYLCIYDKKREIKDNDTLDIYPDQKEVVRFEARLKGSKIDDFTEGSLNPFESVKAYNFSGYDLEGLDEEQECLVIGMIYKIQKGVNPLANMTRRKKEKNKELLDTALKRSVSPEKDFKQEKSRLAGELNDLLRNKDLVTNQL